MRRTLFFASVLCLSACGLAEVPSDESASDSVSAGPLDALSRRFGRVRQRMRDRRYRERGPLPRAFALEGSGTAMPLDLPVGRCTTIVALSGGGMRSLEVTLYDPDGEELAVDSVSGEGGLVHTCPPAPEDARAPRTAPHYLLLFAREGEGAIVASQFDSTPGEGAGFEGLFEGVLAPPVPLRDVEERMAASRATFRERGFSLIGEPRLDRVTEGEVLRVPVELDAGPCYVVIARAGEGLRDIDIYLYDAEGAEVARHLDNDAEPSLEHCPEQAGPFLIELRAYEGAGAAGIMVAAGPKKPAAESVTAAAAPTELAAVAKSEQGLPPTASAEALLVGRGYVPRTTLRDTTMPGEVRAHDVVLGPGCTLVLGAGTPDMDVDLYLSSAEGELLDRDTRMESVARVAACEEEPSMGRVLVKTYGAEGSYGLSVLRAPESLSEVEMLRLDEAASLLRARGYRGRDPIRRSLGEGERFVRTIPVDPGACVAVAAAGDRSVEDVDLFLRNQAGLLLASASGPAPWATAARCVEADAPGEEVQVEVVLYRGSGDVLMMRLDAAREELAP